MLGLVCSSLSMLTQFHRSHRCTQVELHLRMGRLRPPWHRSDLSVRPHLSHKVAHRREALHLPTSRYAHICHTSRPETANPPLVRAECDKSFTRSDALAKHMRIQHNISPPLPGRGGNRKRKREEQAEPAAPAHTPDPYGYSTFKVEAQPDDDEDRKSTRLNSSHSGESRMPSSA